MRFRWIVLGTGLLAVALAAAPLAQAQDASAQHGQRERGPYGGQAVRGTVTAVAADHLTIKTEAGDTYQVAVSANTRLMKNRQPVKITDVKAGDGVGAMGVMDDATKTVHAMFVTIMDAADVQRLRENLGKTYIAGKITAIDMDALKLTVLRSDNVSQVIAVDEGTSFRRGGHMMPMMDGSVSPETGRARNTEQNAGDESITLADIKIGDRVMGQGALKNGVFVPAELHVIDPSQQHRRRADSNATSGVGKPSNQ